MARSTVHYADNETNNILKRLHNKLRPAGTPVQRVEYIIELLLLRVFEVKLKQDKIFKPLRKLFQGENYRLLFSHLLSLTGDQIKSELNKNIFPFYSLILAKAREVFPGNLPQKVQDQLVLIEEVFANSSFSTNVQSGNMTEILGLVQEIDEQRLLKTDLLGDAIESALSETGGTSDIGLYRTPDHIRQLMVALVNPGFTDIVFDPACGTGGFLFDAYQFVLEKATKDEKWPGAKAHPELQGYFKKYFKQFGKKMPSLDVVNSFYRQGVGGIEYLGMIRKMAAVNLYIRGLNPQNIEQGDALKIYDPSIDAGSKSAIIANPPFGAERDQPAYPNVWEEYSRESETTILFIKLMFDLLQKGGRCTVVVSEGFLTWDNKASARAMRKSLLEEANLKAIISLPQGVFVSKNGQGAKTSILYFEKGGPTKKIWYYKIENDGFAMGVNRKLIEGSQLPEIIEIFSKYIKKDKIPPKTKNSFIIPAEWIKTLDPRVKKRIKKEIKREIPKKNKIKREKLIIQLKKKLAEGKIDRKKYKEKLWQFDNIVENKIQNEITKQIEKYHSYHFNLQNYQSDLTEKQIKEWRKIFKDIKPKNNNSIDKQYRELQTTDSKIAFSIIASFNPRNTLEIDITREYLSKLKKKDKKFKNLDEILKKEQQYPFEVLSNLIRQKSSKIKLESNREYKQVTIKLYGKGVILRQKILGEDIKTKSQYIVNKGDFIISKIDARNGAFGIVPENLEGAIVTSSFPYFDINQNLIIPEFLNIIVSQLRFYDQINNMVAGATGRRSVSIKDFLSLKIPLPSIDIQKEIVEKIERQKRIIEGVNNILENWQINKDLFSDGFKKISYPNTLIKTGSTPSRQNLEYFKGDINWFKSGELKNKIISESVEKITNEAIKNSNARLLSKNTVLVALIGATIGDVAILAKEGSINQNVGAFMPWKKCNPKYLFWFLRCYVEDIKKQKKEGAQPNLNLDNLKKFKIILPPMRIQERIVEQLDKEIEMLEKICELKIQVQERIEKILKEVWGG